jgi:2'-5' RNA ligase
MPDESLRTFIAIELDESLRRALQSLQNRLKRQTPPGSVKWVAPEGIHLTLKFLGDTPAARVSEIVAAMRTACTGHGAFDLVVEGRGCFPNFRRPRVVWVAVRDRSQTIGSLQAAIEREVAPLGWPTEERAFTPHLTLGRVSKTADPRAITAVGQAVEQSVVEEIGAQRVSTVHLIRSDLRPTGAIYTSLAAVALKGEPSTART